MARYFGTTTLEDDSTMPTEDALPDASQWRIQLARELAKTYEGQPALEMIVLGGSPSRGLSDAYSDLDLVFYWDGIDHDFLNSRAPLADQNCKRLEGRESSGDAHLETYYLGPLKVDCAHIDLGTWRRTVDELQERWEPEPSTMGSIAGFIDAIPIFGHDKVVTWKRELAPYPDTLCTNFTRANLNCFVPGYLLRQCHERGETLAWFDGLSQSIKRLLNLLAAANRIWFVADDGRWIDFYLDRMQHTPKLCMQRIERILGAPGLEAIAALESLTSEVHAIVDELVPGVDTTRLRNRRVQMEVLGVPTRPVL